MNYYQYHIAQSFISFSYKRKSAYITIMCLKRVRSSFCTSSSIANCASDVFSTGEIEGGKFLWNAIMGQNACVLHEVLLPCADPGVNT